MIFQVPFFQSWNTHCTTRALSAFRSTDLKYLGRQVDDDRRLLAFLAFVQVLRDRTAPVVVQRLALRRFQARAHFQAIGLHQVQRTQHAVQAAEDGHVFLRPVQLLGRQRGRVQPLIHIAIEGQHRLARIGLGEAALPAGVALHIELGQRRAQAHQRGNVVGGLGFEHLDQAGGLIDEQGWVCVPDVQRRVVVQFLGGESKTA